MTLEGLNQQIANLRTHQNELSTVKQKLTDDVADIVLLRSFFSNWQNGINSGMSSEDAYQNAIASISREDNPNTPTDETINEEIIIQKAEDVFNKPAAEITDSDADAIQNDIKQLQASVRNFLGKQMQINMEISDTDTQIKNLQMIKDSETNEMKAQSS